MSTPGQARFTRPLLRKRLRYLAVGLLAGFLLFIGSAMAWAEESITLDFVRHGESGEMDVINTMVPGPGLTGTGQGQADDLVNVLGGPGSNIDGIFASTMIRSQETADPLAQALGMSTPVPELSGLNEINAGIFEGIPVNVGGIPLGGALYLLAPAMWTLGFYFVPELGSTDANGMVFEDRVNGAVQTIYDSSAANGGGTDAVFSHEGTIAIWTLMNVNNPDFPLVLDELLTKGELLPYTGIVEVQGNPEDGWTLISWDGQPVPQDPGLPTDLFVDARHVITAPQMAAYHILESTLTGNPTTIANAIQAGVGEIGTATVNFPLAVTTDLVDTLRGGIQNVLTDPSAALNAEALLIGFNMADVAALPALATDAAALLPGELGAMIGEALALF